MCKLEESNKCTLTGNDCSGIGSAFCERKAIVWDVKQALSEPMKFAIREMLTSDLGPGYLSDEELPGNGISKRTMDALVSRDIAIRDDVANLYLLKHDRKVSEYLVS